MYFIRLIFAFFYFSIIIIDEMKAMEEQKINKKHKIKIITSVIMASATIIASFVGGAYAGTTNIGVQNVITNVFNKEPATTSINPNVNTSSSSDSAKYTVPNVTGKSQVDATTILKTQGFATEIIEEYSETVSKGNIIRQYPSFGDTAKSKSVALVISLGKESKTVYLNSIKFITESELQDNACSPFSGKDNFENICENGLKFNFISSGTPYFGTSFENKKSAKYKTSFSLSGKFNCLTFELTNGGFNNFLETINFVAKGDGNVLYSAGVTRDSGPTQIKLDVSNIDVLTFEISGAITYNGSGSIILSNAILN